MDHVTDLHGATKCRASIEAVTTTLRAWRPAAMAPAMSIQDMIFPPKIVPRAFASDGRTISVMVTVELV